MMTVTVGITEVQDAFGVYYARLLAGAVLAGLPVAIVYLIFQRRVTQAIMLSAGRQGLRAGADSRPQPAKSIEEAGVLFREVAPRLCGDDVDAHPRAVPDVDEAVLHDRVGQALDDVVPPGRVADRVLEGDEVVRQGGRDLDQRRQAEQAVADAMRGHQDAVQVGVLGDPLQLGDAADIARVRPDDVDGVALDQLLEVLAEIDLLAGVDRRRWWRCVTSR